MKYFYMFENYRRTYSRWTSNTNITNLKSQSEHFNLVLQKKLGLVQEFSNCWTEEITSSQRKHKDQFTSLTCDYTNIHFSPSRMHDIPLRATAFAYRESLDQKRKNSFSFQQKEYALWD